MEGDFRLLCHQDICFRIFLRCEKRTLILPSNLLAKLHCGKQGGLVSVFRCAFSFVINIRHSVFLNLNPLALTMVHNSVFFIINSFNAGNKDFLS